jgi:amino acid permease
MTRSDSPIKGLLIGLGTLLLGVIVIYALLYGSRGISPQGFMRIMAYMPDQAAKVLSLAMIAEIIPITWVKRKKLDGTARGMFIAIMLIAMAIIWFKFVA